VGRETAEDKDIALLAKGGRTNVFGFLLRLAARLPFLFIAGRMYGAETLGRFAYAILVIEFAAQLATLGLKRGLAQRLSSSSDEPAVHIVWDGLLIAGLASTIAVVILAAFPHVMFPNSGINGREQLLPLTIYAIAWSEVALAALAYRHNVGAAVTARAIVEPWTISIAALAFWFYSPRDGLILSYVVSMVAALAAAIWPLLRMYGLPHGWRPKIVPLFQMAHRNVPLAAADAIEWATRNIDRAILGLFFPPAVVGIYWVAQQIVTLPQKLKTSFDPILGPVITQNLEAGNRIAVAAHVRQVGFWILAAQTGIALALSISGEAVMGLVGPAFVAGTGALIILLAAEVVAATAAVSETALVYVARHRNLMISTGVIGTQVALSFLFIEGARTLGLPQTFQAAGPALALMVALGIGAVFKSRLLAKLLGAPVSGWRWPLISAAAVAGAIGAITTRIPEWSELLIGTPVVLAAYSYIIWRKGFTPEDRVLFKRLK
jgi:O-antigen/teichoic acid export membrane protein